MAYPRFTRARDFKFIKKTAGNYTINNISWTNLDTGLDLVLRAEIGDVIEAAVSCWWAQESTDGYLDMATLVSGSPVHYFGGTGAGTNAGVSGWGNNLTAGGPASGPVMYTLVSGDISADTVTLRLLFRTSVATNKTLKASADFPFFVQAKNLGPVDPH